MEGDFLLLTVFTNNSLCKHGTCTTPDRVPGAGVTESKHPGLWGASGQVGEAVGEESDGPKREGQPRGWSSSEDAGVRRSRTSWREGKACCVQVSSRVLLPRGMGAGLGEEVRLSGMRAGECIINYNYYQLQRLWADRTNMGRWVCGSLVTPRVLE